MLQCGCGQNAYHVYMWRTCISYVVSAVEMVQLLWCSTHNSNHFVEFQIENIWECAQNFEGQCRKPRYKYIQNFYDDGCSTYTNMENFALLWFLSTSPQKSTHLVWDIMPTVCSFVNGYNHDYTFCVAISSHFWMPLSTQIFSYCVDYMFFWKINFDFI
jgi:hypothetical protein